MDYLTTDDEKLWVDMYHYLICRGYQLRPRYHPDWHAPWLNQDISAGKKPLQPSEYEDSVWASSNMNDGVRLEDGRKVIFKRVETQWEELTISTFLSSNEMRADPRNCSVPILDVIMIPGDADHALIVMPLLIGFDNIPFRRLGEFCEAAIQFLEVSCRGLEFLHEHYIAHRDFCWGNLMMDSSKVIPKGHHFRNWFSHTGLLGQRFEYNTRWKLRPHRYYIIDYGISTRCTSSDAWILGVCGQDKTVPEMSETVPYNPFKLDVYQLGNVFKKFTDIYEGTEVFRQLADAMTRKDPNDRPTASEAVLLGKEIISQIERSGEMSKRIWPRRTRFTSKLGPLERLAVVLWGYNPLHI
ncbi:hypothetical protein CPC08DRAFT_637755 [Agrocybe pediades]|nr:hypothetical protein CPC08DRAFT_637755 [Agrocybe pediades]